MLEALQMDPELAELKEREWLRESRTSFVPTARLRLQASKGQRRLRRATEEKDYPSSQVRYPNLVSG